MPTTKQVRRSVTLPAQIAQQVERLAKRRLSDNRVLVELIEQDIEATKHKEQMFFELAELLNRRGRGQETRRPVGPLRFRGIMPQIENWSRLPAAIRDQLLDRMRDCEIGVDDLKLLRLRIEVEAGCPRGTVVRGFHVLRTLPGRKVCENLLMAGQAAEGRKL
jgi:hypothetical protein